MRIDRVVVGRRRGAVLAALGIVVGLTAGPALAAPDGFTQRTVTAQDQIFTIDAATGATNLIAATGLVPTTSLAAAPDGTLYATNTDNNLYRIDPATAVPTLIGPLGALIGGGTLTATGDGHLWGSSGTNLYRIDRTTGAATLVGSMGAVPVTGLAGTCDGRLFGVLSNDTLVSVNPATGASTTIGPTGLASFGLIIAFDDTGTLWGLGTIAFVANLYTIDLATGAATIGPVTQNDQNTIAFPRTCPAAVTAPAATPIQTAPRFAG